MVNSFTIANKQRICSRHRYKDFIVSFSSVDLHVRFEFFSRSRRNCQTMYEVFQIVVAPKICYGWVLLLFVFLLWVYCRILWIPTLDLFNYLSVIRGLSCNTSFFFLLSAPVPHCLSDVQLIPPCDRILLEMTYSDLYKWAIKELRAAIMQSDMKFKSRGINPAIPPVDISKVLSKFTFTY